MCEVCPVCGGSGWVKAAPVSGFSRTHQVPRIALWARAVVVPCFNCIMVDGPDVLERL